MGPISFNVYQSTVSAAPAVLIGYVAGILTPHDVPAPDIPSNLSEFAKLWTAESYKIAPSVNHVIQPFIVPILLLFTAWCCARGCLHAKDSTPTSRVRCRNAYLYYDGTFGLVPQCLLATAITLGILCGQYDLSPPQQVAAFGIIGTLAVIGTVYSRYLSFNKFPKLLFVLNDYSPQRPKWWQLRWRDKPANAAPWNKYIATLCLFAGFGSWIILLGFWIFSTACIYGLAWLRVSLRLWFHHHV